MGASSDKSDRSDKSDESDESDTRTPSATYWGSDSSDLSDLSDKEPLMRHSRQRALGTRQLMEVSRGSRYLGNAEIKSGCLLCKLPNSWYLVARKQLTTH